jgi:hypothetical protein
MGFGVETRFSWLRRADKVGVNLLLLRTEAFSLVLRGESQVTDPRLRAEKRCYTSLPPLVLKTCQRQGRRFEDSSRADAADRSARLSNHPTELKPDTG